VTVDRFGIPDSTFGVVPDDFYGLLGRVVALGALVEMRFGDVVGRLTAKTEAQLAGKQMSQLLDLFDKVAKGQTVPDRLPGLRDRTDRAMQQRNTLVHSLWPAPRLDEAKGWRGVTPSRRPASGEPIVWTYANEDQMVGLVRELVELSSALRDQLPLL
jgi:hypothetical protein